MGGDCCICDKTFNVSEINEEGGVISTSEDLVSKEANLAPFGEECASLSIKAHVTVTRWAAWISVG